MRVRARIGSLLTNSLAKVNIIKVESKDKGPRLTNVLDHRSKTSNELLTPGGAVQLEGRRLNFDESDPEQGVFLINTVSQVAVRIELVMHNKPSLIWFEVPQTLPPGTYHLEVRTKPNGHVTNDRLPEVLTVNPV
jgi:hypothetical protein